jgi:hypothetical protein
MNPAWRAWDATGRLLLGRHQLGSLTERMQGDLDEVHAYQGVVKNVTRIP